MAPRVPPRQPSANTNAQFLDAMRRSTNSMDNLAAKIGEIQDFITAQSAKARGVASSPEASTPPPPPSQAPSQPSAQPASEPYVFDPTRFVPEALRQQQEAGGPSDSASYPPDSTQAQEEVNQTEQRTRRTLRGYLRGVRGDFRTRQQQSQQAGDVSGSASEPPDSPEAQQQPQEQQQQQQQQQEQPGEVLAWEMMGESGGPQFLRNLRIRQYGIEQSLGWGQQMAGSLSPYLPSKQDEDGGILNTLGLNQENMGTLQNALATAQEHSGALALGAGGLITAGHALNSVHGFFRNAQSIGQQFGYGPGPGGPGFLGFHNPLSLLSPGTEMGLRTTLLEQALQGRVPDMGFGSGLTTNQAQATVQTLAGQGFGLRPGGTLLSDQGDMARIAQNFFRPELSQYPGLNPEELGLFTPMLRNAGTSIGQLTEELSNLGGEARASKLTLNDYVSSLAEVSQQFEQMGSTPQGGLAVARGFTDYTALPPQFAGQFAQSPLVQGMAMSQYGVLPSGLGDMNPGAFSNLALSSLQMLQRATQGLHHDIHRTINGHRVLIESGQQRQIDQIASMSGVPANVVRRMLGDQQGIAARSTAGQSLGSVQNGGTGFENLLLPHERHGQLNLSPTQYQHLNRVWMDTVAPTWRGTGISQAEMQRLDHIRNLQTRAGDYRRDLQRAGARDKWNQIQQNPHNMQIGLTPQAAKWFQLVGGRGGPSQNKQLSNAGMPNVMGNNGAYNSVLNSPSGDLGNLNNLPFMTGR